MTNHEIQERLQSVANAVANNRLEGLETDPETITELERAARGEIDIADVLRNLKARIAAGQF